MLEFIANELENFRSNFNPKSNFNQVEFESNDLDQYSLNTITSTDIGPSNSVLIDLDEIDWAAEASNMQDQSVSNVSAALEALANLIRHNSSNSIELQCVGKFPLIFSLLGLHGYLQIQLRALEVILWIG